MRIKRNSSQSDRENIIIDEIETLEARYDAMPPEIARRLSRGSAAPLRQRYNALQMEIAFTRRMFRASHRAGKARRRRNAGADKGYREDCRHWWHRYRKARASAAQLRGLMALKAMITSIESGG